MLGWLWIALTGLVVGVLARLIMPGRNQGGIIITMLLGIGGSLLATWVGHQIHWYGPGESVGFVASILGAMSILGIYRLIRG